MDLGTKGKTALVLSAGGEFGRAIAVALAREGANLAVTDLDEDALAETASQLESLGVRTLSAAVDLSNTGGLEAFITCATQELDGVDILVNISSGPPPTKAANVTAHQWTKQFNAMVVSIIHVTSEPRETLSVDAKKLADQILKRVANTMKAQAHALAAKAGTGESTNNPTENPYSPERRNPRLVV